jgi:uncharacterized membrane protein
MPEDQATDVTQSKTQALAASPLPQVAQLKLCDLRQALVLGFADFRAAPQFGLFFSAVYVLGGIVLIWLGAGTVAWTFAMTLGFPLIAPFAAVGLYEVSRRLRSQENLRWGKILGVVNSERERQIPWMGAIILIYFLFWSFLAHMIFALFMGLSVMRNVSSSFEVFLTPNGLTMIGVELFVGAILAFFLFALTVTSLPHLLEKEVDFVTAMLLSVQVVKQNLCVMLIWASVVAVLTVLAMAPLFLGLFIVMPVLGHATWHLYKRALI